MYKYLGLIYIGNEGSYSDMKFTIKTGEAVITEAGHAANVIGDFPDKFQLISAEDCELILSNGTVTVNSPYPFYNQLDDFDPEVLLSLPTFEDEDEDGNDVEETTKPDEDEDGNDVEETTKPSEDEVPPVARSSGEDATEPDCETQ